YVAGGVTSRPRVGGNALLPLSWKRLDLPAFRNDAQIDGRVAVAGDAFRSETRVVNWSGSATRCGRREGTFCGMGLFVCCWLRTAYRICLPDVCNCGVVSSRLRCEKRRVRVLWRGQFYDDRTLLFDVVAV